MNNLVAVITLALTGVVITLSGVVVTTSDISLTQPVDTNIPVKTQVTLDECESDCDIDVSGNVNITINEDDSGKFIINANLTDVSASRV